MLEQDPGHLFMLEHLDLPRDGMVPIQKLRFVKRQGIHYPGNVGAYSGTTSQEVLRALIARAKYVNRQIPSWPTIVSIWLMRLIIFVYEWRAKRVKGKWLSPLGFSKIESEMTCKVCGHIRCLEVH